MEDHPLPPPLPFSSREHGVPRRGTGSADVVERRKPRESRSCASPVWQDGLSPQRDTLKIPTCLWTLWSSQGPVPGRDHTFPLSMVSRCRSCELRVPRPSPELPHLRNTEAQCPPSAQSLPHTPGLSPQRNDEGKPVNIPATLLNKQLSQGECLLQFLMTDYPSDLPQRRSPEEIRHGTLLRQGWEKTFL